MGRPPKAQDEQFVQFVVRVPSDLKARVVSNAPPPDSEARVVREAVTKLLRALDRGDLDVAGLPRAGKGGDDHVGVSLLPLDLELLDKMLADADREKGIKVTRADVVRHALAVHLT